MRRGIGLDAEGRCAHYHSTRDVILNRCAICGDYFACHHCHEELCDHSFGRMTIDDPTSTQCGRCSTTMSAREYFAVTSCPCCGAQFNQGCERHRSVYYQV